MWVGNSKNFLGNYLLFIWFDTIKKKKKKKKKNYIYYILLGKCMIMILFDWFIFVDL